MKKTTIAGMVLCVISAAFLFWFGPSALAHEGREVGDYTISIGWRVEPAYVGVANGPEFTIAVAAQHAEGEAAEAASTEATPEADHQAEEGAADAESTPETDHHAEEGEATSEQPHTNQAAADHAEPEVDEAILNATETLTLTVHFGNQSRKLKLIADPETPGRFFADLIPTRPGDYTFRLTGMLGDTEVDEEFSSADGEFSTIEPAGDLLFPDTKADAVSLQSQLEALKTQVEALQKELEAIKAAQE